MQPLQLNPRAQPGSRTLIRSLEGRDAIRYTNRAYLLIYNTFKISATGFEPVTHGFTVRCSTN